MSFDDVKPPFNTGIGDLPASLTSPPTVPGALTGHSHESESAATSMEDSDSAQSDASSAASGNKRKTRPGPSQLTREELRRAALQDTSERASHLANHPLNQRPVKILTSSIKEAFLATCEAVKFKRPGCYFTADFRMGKSTAELMVKEQIQSVLPKVAVLLISAQVHDNVTERAFWGDVLEAMGLSTSGTAQERRTRAYAAIIAACAEAGGQHFHLFIDEGQNWTTSEYTRMRDLGNLTCPLRTCQLWLASPGLRRLIDLR